MKSGRHKWLSGVRKRVTAGLIAGFLLMFCPELSLAASSVPWKDNFETNVQGQAVSGMNGWLGPTTIIIVNTNTPSQAGTNACESTNSTCSLTNLFSGVAAKRVVTDLYFTPAIKKSAGNPTFNSLVSCQVYFNSNGYPVVADGPLTNWVVCSTAPGGAPVAPITDGAWTRIAVLENASNQTWNLFVNNQLVKQNAAFSSASITNYNGFILKGSTYVDNAWVDASLPSTTNNNGNPELTGDGNADGVADAWALFYFGTATNVTGSMSASGDFDSDGRSNLEEYQDKTDPTDPSSRLAGGIWTLPYVESFDSAPLPSVHNWHGLTASPSNSFFAQNTYYYQGGRAMAVSTGQLTLAITDATATNVWVDMYVKMGALVTESAPVLPTNQASAFYVNKSGYFVAYNGTVSNWITLTNSYTNIAYRTDAVTPVNVTNWFRVIINQDFGSKQWSLFTADNATNRIATNIAANLGFCTNTISQFGGFSITNSVTNLNPYAAYIDSLVISSNRPDVIDSDCDGIPDNWEAAYTNGVTNLLATADSDGDGVNNLNEYIGGTNPNDSNDYVRVMAMDPVGRDLQLNFRIGSNRNYRVYSADSVSIVKSLAANSSATFWQTNVVWTDTNAVTGCITLHRFYTLSAERGGLIYTNAEQWAMYLQPKYSGLWNMCGTPVDFESGNANTLTNTMGTQLMRGFRQISGSDTNGDQLYVLSGTNAVSNTTSFVRHWVANSQWWAGSPQAATNTAIGPMQGFWVWRKEAFTTNTVITGRTRTNAVYTAGVSNSWNFLAWPFATERAMTNTPDIGWGFLKCGGVGANDAGSADNIFVVQSNSWKRFYLMPDSNWWDYVHGGYVNFTMKPGQGFYYYHRGNGFVWTNSYGP